MISRLSILIRVQMPKITVPDPTTIRVSLDFLISICSGSLFTNCTVNALLPVRP